MSQVPENLYYTKEHEWIRIDGDEALILQLLGEREEARSNKDFGKADQIRQKIESLGVSIEDGPNGPVWMKK